MTNTQDCSETEVGLVRAVLEQMAEDLTLLVDRDLVFTMPECVRQDERPVGYGSIHISFRLGFKTEYGTLHGFLLVPLADAISLAGFLLEIPEAGIQSKREDDTLDNGIKDAMVEIGNMIGGSASNALRAMKVEGVQVRFTGCQGVRDGVRPALIYADGMTLVVATATASLEPFEDFQAILALPDLSAFLAHAAVRAPEETGEPA